MMIHNYTPATDGDVYVRPEERDGDQSVVWFTRDISPQGIRKAFAKVAGHLEGKVAVKLHTGEQHGPNIIPAAWVQELIDNDIPDATIIETNTYYVGDRDTTEKHRETLRVNGWTFCPVDITDEEGFVELPVEGGNWFDTMAVGSHLPSYDSMLTLTHFKGHMMGGFGGSNKNIGIGCASGIEGKKWIHAHTSDNGQTWDHQWSVDNEELMEKITESTKATIDHFGEHVVYVNVMRNMSVSCDCEGLSAQPVVTPNVGILASTDICAIDSACVDLVFAMTNGGLVHNHDLVERMTSRHGFRQLSYMHDLGMGNWRYRLLDLDNDEAELNLADAVTHVVPFERQHAMSEAFCDYISQADEAHRADLIDVYLAMKAVLPDEEERINWGMPTFGNNIIHFAAAKRHVGIYPGPEAVEHFTPTLDERRLKHSKGAIQMPYGRVDLSLVTQIAEYCRDHGREGH